MSDLRYTITVDLTPLLAWFNAAPEKIRAGVEKGTYESANLVMAASQEIVPVDLGTLKGSGVVLAPEWRGSTCVVELGYGGAASAYAARQHEDLTYRHKPGQSAKYLERPMLEEERNVRDRIARAISREIG